MDEADAAAEDESASEVVALDEKSRLRSKKRKEGDLTTRTKGKTTRRLDASAALAGVRDEDDEYEVRDADEEREVVVAAPAKWGPSPAILMFLTVLVMFLGGLMAFETSTQRLGVPAEHEADDAINQLVRRTRST